MGIYPVTQAQWRWATRRSPSRFKGNDRPVDSVSWNDCQEFCSRLSKKTGQRFCLPSEAQWEYACRAGTTTPFFFGLTISTDQANYDSNFIYSGGREGIYREQTTAVGSFPANAWGLYDMHGNVWEWCQDWYGPYQDGDEKAYRFSDPGTTRVLRGGSWYYFPVNCRSGHRDDGDPSYRNDYHGCRVLLCLD